MIQNASPIIVKIISPPKDETGLAKLSDVLIGSLGLTGAMVLAALLLGAVMAVAMFWWRRRAVSFAPPRLAPPSATSDISESR